MKHKPVNNETIKTQNMRLKVGSNGELKVEGCAKLRQPDKMTKPDYNPINPEDDDFQTWVIETKMGNELKLPAIGGPYDSARLTTLDTDPLPNDKKEDIKKNCPIACGMFYTRPTFTISFEGNG